MSKYDLLPDCLASGNRLAHLEKQVMEREKESCGVTLLISKVEVNMEIAKVNKKMDIIFSV